MTKLTRALPSFCVGLLAAPSPDDRSITGPKSNTSASNPNASVGAAAGAAGENVTRKPND